MRRLTGMAAILGLALALSSCAARNLLFTTYTTVGLDIALTDAQPSKAVFGYKRFEGAIVPVDPSKRTADQKDPDADEGEAMSVYAALDLKNEWGDGLNLLQVFATGQAAQNAAANPGAFADMIQSLRNEEEQDEDEDEEEEENKGGDDTPDPGDPS